MQGILQVLKFCWRALNFIRDCVMNLVFLLFVLLAFSVFGVVSSYHLSSNESVTLQGNQGALLLNLDGYLTDNRATSGWRSVLAEIESKHVPQQISTFDVVYAIEQAKNDDRIQGIVLDLNYFQGADLPAIRYVGEALQHFKQEDKIVIAVADYYGQSQYLLASFADKIYLNRAGAVDIHGLAYQNLYYKSLLDKLEITPHIFRVGTYKSAVEPFLRDDMSPEAKFNAQRWLNLMWADFVSTVANNRQIKAEDVLPQSTQYIAQLKGLKGDITAYSQQRNLVTDVKTRAQINQELMAVFGSTQDKTDFKSVDFAVYLNALPDRMTSDNPQKIAVVNVEGTIIDGENDENNVGGDSISRLLRQAANDDKVKALVLRVNSPGGSAFASELMRQELENVRSQGKPVVVSMGSMAASGGYWISAGADYIVADQSTITGSIGIFAMFPTFENTLKKAGIHADGISTSSLSQSGFSTGLNQDVKDILQLNIEYGYDQFLDLVSKGRKITKEQADKVAQGQIWLGEQARSLGLVDELGNFDNAINKAAQLAKLEDYGVEWMQETDDSFVGTLFADLSAVQNAIIQGLGLPQEVKQIPQNLSIFSQFNDPKGQYLYCLNCMEAR